MEERKRLWKTKGATPNSYLPELQLASQDTAQVTSMTSSIWSPYEDKFHISIIRSPEQTCWRSNDLHSIITAVLTKNKLVTAHNKPEHSYSIQEIAPCSTAIFLLFP